MKSKSKLGHSPLESAQNKPNQYDFITGQNSEEKIRNPEHFSTKNEQFNINEEFKKERELRINKLNNNTQKSAAIKSIPLNVLQALKDFLKL